MWLIPLILLFVSSILFVFVAPLSFKLSDQYSGMHHSYLENVIKTVAILLFITALVLNTSIWKAESAFILTITLFGPFMFFAIYKKSEAKS